MPRGGKRNGRPGASYTNRTDLNQPVRTAPGQTYGQAGQQAAAQKAVPLPSSPQPSPAAAPPPQAPGGPQAAPQAAQGFAPPDPGMLSAPSAKPGEPVTAGLPMGAGAGPDVLGPYGEQDQVLANLRAAYAKAPNDGLRQIIARLEVSRGVP